MRSAIKAGVLAGGLGLFGATAAFGQATPTATYTLDPDSGPVGTPIAVTGTTTCPDNPDGPDIELFFLFARNFTGRGPSMDFEVEDDGSFSGTFIAPDPVADGFTEADGETTLDRSPDGVFFVLSSCTDASGDGNSGQTEDETPTFTITQAADDGATDDGGSDDGATDDGGSDSTPLPEAQPATPQEAQPTFTG